MPGQCHHHRGGAPGRRLAAHIFCGFCEESCPVDAIVETRLYEYHFEDTDKAAGNYIMTKEKLLAMGDKYEAQLAEDRAAQAKYR